MSHFTTLVILPDGFCQDKLTELLAPYDERTEVTEYDRKCWCVGKTAERRAEALMEKEMGTWDEVKAKFNATHPTSREDPFAHEDEWRHEVYRPRSKRQAQLLGDMDDRYAPDPECEECHGTGFYRSQYNPKSKWDWWVIGGRWTGKLGTYDPAQDKENYKTCWLCGGTGSRPDADYGPDDDWARRGEGIYPCREGAKGCNGCGGSGMQIGFASDFKNIDNVNIVKSIPPDFTPYSLVTPDGEWHEKGHMGWFGVSTNEDDDWPVRYRSLIEPHQDKTAVLCDLHI